MSSAWSVPILLGMDQHWKVKNNPCTEAAFGRYLRKESVRQPGEPPFQTTSGFFKPKLQSPKAGKKICNKGCSAHLPSPDVPNVSNVPNVPGSSQVEDTWSDIRQCHFPGVWLRRFAPWPVTRATWGSGHQSVNLSHGDPLEKKSLQRNIHFYTWKVPNFNIYNLI